MQPKPGGCRGPGGPHAAAAAAEPPDTPAQARRARDRHRPDLRAQHLGRQRRPRPRHHGGGPRAGGPLPLRRARPLHDQRRPRDPDVRGRPHRRRLRPLHGHRPRPHPDDRLLRRARRGQGARPVRGVLPADRGMVPHQLLRPPRLPPRDADQGLAAHAEVLRRVRHRARRPLRTRLPETGRGPGRRGRREGRLPRVRPRQRAGHPERRPLRPGHGPVRDLRRQRGGAGRRRRPRRQRLLRLLPPGRRLRLLRRDRLPGPSPRERPRLRPPRPLHPGRAEGPSATGTS